MCQILNKLPSKIEYKIKKHFSTGNAGKTDIYANNFFLTGKFLCANLSKYNLGLRANLPLFPTIYLFIRKPPLEAEKTGVMNAPIN